MPRLGFLAASAVTLLLSAPALAQTPPTPGQPPPKDRLLPVERRSAVPYEDQKGVMLFQMLVGDRGVWAILDTNLPVSLVDTKLARDLGLTLEPTTGTVTAPNGVTLPILRAKDVPLTVPGQVRLTASQFPAVDLKPLTTRLDREIGFIFTQSFLRQMVLMVNPEQHLFNLGPTGSVTGGPPGSIEVALKPGTSTTTISSGGKTLTVGLSTGTRFSLCLSPSAWEALSPSISAVSQDSADGVPLRTAKLKDVTFGGVTMHDIDICGASSSGEGVDGVIGYPLLSRYVFAMDTTAGKLWLQPRPAAIGAK